MVGTSCWMFCRRIWDIRKLFLIIIAYLVPIGFLLNWSLESRCAYVMVTMAILWLTEALPIAITALTPLFLLPLLAVQPSKVVSRNYFSDTSALCLVGLIFGVAMHEVNLHKRISMRTTMIIGTSPSAIMLSLMLLTWFLSMWISNTAATSMMLPILIAISEQTLELDQDTEAYDTTEPRDDTGTQDIRVTPVEHGDPDQNTSLQYQGVQSKPGHDSKHLNKGFTLSVAYAASFGGIATLNGSFTNMVFQAQVDKHYQDYGADDSGITYGNWMGFAFPLSLIMLFLTWIWLQIVFVRCRCLKAVDKKRQATMMAFLKREYNKLGNIKFGEIVVLVFFILMSLMFLFRNLPGVGGWGDFFVDPEGKSTVTDATGAILMATFLFILPKKLPKLFCCNCQSDLNNTDYAPILTWQIAEKKVAWGVIVLIGGGFALADASNTSGLSQLVSCELRALKDLDPWVMNLVLCLIVAGVTEFKSNTTTLALFMPIMFELSVTVGIHPLYLMISTCIACTFAFVLPMSSAPTAIVFSTGAVRIPDMAMTGSILKLLSVGVLTLAINTWGKVIFKLDTLPDIFLNSTQVSTCPGTETQITSTQANPTA